MVSIKTDLNDQIIPSNIDSLTQQLKDDTSNDEPLPKQTHLISKLFFSNGFQKFKTIQIRLDPKILLGFLIGTSISLVAITLLKYYSPLIVTLIGGGIGATFLGLGGAIFGISTKPVEINYTSTNLSEDNNTDFLSWLYLKEIEPKLKKTYLVLIGLLLICFLIALLIHSSNNLLEDFSINMASELMGILLVLFAVDRVIETEREKKDKKKERVAMQQIKQPILHHFYILLETFQKVTNDTNNESNTSKIKEIADIFERLNNEEISQVSESIKSTDKLLYSIDDRDWLDYLSQESASTKESLNRIVEKYSLFLQPSLLRSIEEFINSSFIRLIVDYHDKVKLLDESEHILQNQEELFDNPEFILLLKQHLVKFFKLIKLFNKNTGSQEKNIVFN